MVSPSSQERVDQIRAFTHELQALEDAKVLALDAADKARISDYHQSVLAQFSQHSTLDFSDNAKSLSLGMRAFSMVAAAAIMVFLILVVAEIWPHLGYWGRAGVLAAGTFASLAIAFVLQQKDTYGYFTKVAAVAAVACFGINLVGLGALTNSNSLLGFCLLLGLYTWLIAHIFQTPILLWLFSGLSFFTIGLLGSNAEPREFWHVFDSPEIIFALPMWLALVYKAEKWLGLERFSLVYLVAAGWSFFGLAMVLVMAPEQSLLSWSHETIEWFYRIIALLGAAVFILYAIRRGFIDAIQHGLAMLIVFIAIEFVARLIDVLPGYLLFLLLGVMSLGCIWLLRTFHKRELLQKWMDNL